MDHAKGQKLPNPQISLCPLNPTRLAPFVPPESSTLAVREVRLDDDRKLLQRVSLPMVGPNDVESNQGDVYRAHNIELRMCPATDEELWQTFGDLVRASTAIWRGHSTAFVPPLVCTVDICGFRVLCSAYTEDTPKAILSGAGSRTISNKSVAPSFSRFSFGCFRSFGRPSAQRFHICFCRIVILKII